jgi:hypothetical protein
MKNFYEFDKLFLYQGFTVLGMFVFGAKMSLVFS